MKRLTNGATQLAARCQWRSTIRWRLDFHRESEGARGEIGVDSLAMDFQGRVKRATVGRSVGPARGVGILGSRRGAASKRARREPEVYFREPHRFRKLYSLYEPERLTANRRRRGSQLRVRARTSRFVRRPLSFRRECPAGKCLGENRRQARSQSSSRCKA